MALTGNAGDNPVVNSLCTSPDGRGSYSNTKTCRGNYYAYPTDGNAYTYPPHGNVYTYPTYANAYTYPTYASAYTRTYFYAYANAYTRTYFYAHANLYTNAQYAGLVGVWRRLAQDRC